MNLLEVARIVKPHGLGGEVGVLMHWAESDVLLRVTRVQLTLADGTSVEHEIDRARQSGRGFLVKFRGVNDRNAAEALRGARVLLDRSCLPVPDPGEAYLTDLIGRDVVGPDAVLLGRVIDIASYPSVDSLVIQRLDGSNVEQPLVDDWVQPLDTSPTCVVLRSLDGLVDS